jgi:hypothetical protein
MRSIMCVVLLLAAAAAAGGGNEKSAPAAPAPEQVTQPAPANRVPEEPPPPPPAPPPQAVAVVESETGVPECDEYLALFDEMVVKCDKELGPARDAVMQSRDSMHAAFAQWKTLDEESLRATKEAAAQGCGAAVDALRQSWQSMGCMTN